MVLTDTLHFDEHRVTARDQECNVRKGRGSILEQRRQQMAFEMVHSYSRNIPRVRKTSSQGRSGQ